MHRIWELVKESFGWQGGTIHQVAEKLGYNHNLEYGKLLHVPGDRIVAKVNKQGTEMCLVFKSYDKIVKNKEGQYWCSFSAFAPGFNEGGNMSGLDARNIVEG